jgi:hypothetical protein
MRRKNCPQPVRVPDHLVTIANSIEDEVRTPTAEDWNDLSVKWRADLDESESTD